MAEETQNLSQEQIDNLKEKITNQIKDNSNFSREQKDQFVQKIQSLDNEGFIEFLKKQGIIKEQDSGEGGTGEKSSQSSEQSGGGEGGGKQQCVFCSIVFGDIPSRKIAENEKALAVLEINPLTKGHTLVIPKEHISDQNQIPEEAKQLAMEVSKKMKVKLEPKEVKFEGKQMFGHQVLNIIPLYEGQDPNQLQQTQASKEELEDLEEKLKIEKPAPEQEPSPESSSDSEGSQEEQEEKEQINEKDYWLPKRKP